MNSWRILQGDAIERLREIPDESVQVCVTSPPYFGLRDYGVPPRVWDGDPACDHEWGALERGKRQDIRPLDETTSAARLGTDERQAQAALNGGRFCGLCDAWLGCLGLEPTLDLYVAHLVRVFVEVRRVLRGDGTLWLNLGDSYASKPRGSDAGWDKSRLNNPGRLQKAQAASLRRGRRTRGGAKEKDLLMVPATVALALRDDGWWLRKDIIWHKRSPMPENVHDRPASAHEHLFLLAKSPRYFYDAEAVREDDAGHASGNGFRRDERISLGGPGQDERWEPGGGRHLRDVWTLSSQPFPEAHFATFPPKLVEPCILAGSSPEACGECGAPWRRVVERGESSWPARKVAGATRGGVAFDGNVGAGTQRAVHGKGVSHDLSAAPPRTVGWEPTCDHSLRGGASLVLDPFAGAGTTGVVALQHGRSFVGIELNPEYVELARRRMLDEHGLIAAQTEARDLLGDAA